MPRTQKTSSCNMSNSDTVGVIGTPGCTKKNKLSAILFPRLEPPLLAAAQGPGNAATASAIWASFSRRHKAHRHCPQVHRQLYSPALRQPRLPRYRIAGGATVKPFVTHQNDLNLDLYLRIALVSCLERHVVGGLDQVYEIWPVFRNEGVDSTHNPEFLIIEFDIRDVIESLIESLLKYFIGEKTTLTFLSEGTDNEKEPLRRVQQTRRNVRLLDKLIGELSLVYISPAFNGKFVCVIADGRMSPLAKFHQLQSGLCKRFEGFMCQKDLFKQRLRFEERVRQKEQAAASAFLRIITPYQAATWSPASERGIGVGRLVTFLTDSAIRRDTVVPDGKAGLHRG
ncbi:uncharacterized protein PHACADRAFT_203141 [Phanerochaete carnosa HHB-10118-sp]|uniref:Aminoacyl-transfer RNA synthetases class-II family profile domain-containing protein n=1 Tax=Phanerochaete carnosa (strain HHB-10118-sp) TaxID=650164 RepID=K5VNB0_PHACS|nr:uncharacterized protein PHACADRAFT_203141 [Phanerochaete carnosa HHB-10118-sp]EKM48180.1 hypothetical protein PHACADRAFT_203141 [Phanerochaete carnosa HHB-10118-sp]